MKAFPIIVSSPSGAGKTTIVDAVLKRNKTVSRVVTATTRAPRTGEKNGVDYHFWTIKQFEQAIKKGQMLQGARTMLKEYPDAATVFIVPPSLKELKKRILGRNDNTQDIEIRLETAKKEMLELEHYNYALLNDDLAEAVDKMAGIIAAEQCRVSRQDTKITDLK